MKSQAITIRAPQMKTVAFKIIGTTPYVQHKFSRKAKALMIATQEAGSTPARGKKREPKDFDAGFREAMYLPSTGHWPNGAIPATQIKAAMVAACRLLDLTMVLAKICFWVEADGYDPDELIPLIKITKGIPRRFDQAVRNDDGSADIRARPKWDPGWEAIVRITYDASMFKPDDIANLLLRAGLQVGIGEGRSASRDSTGVGWGAFTIASSNGKAEGRKSKRKR